MKLAVNQVSGFQGMKEGDDRRFLVTQRKDRLIPDHRKVELVQLEKFTQQPADLLQLAISDQCNLQHFPRFT